MSTPSIEEYVEQETSRKQVAIFNGLTSITDDENASLLLLIKLENLTDANLTRLTSTDVIISHMLCVSSFNVWGLF
jgi:hypothetical protein